MSFASAEAVIGRSMLAWRPPPRLSLSQWSDEKFRLSAESAAEPGPWKTLPYQRGIMDAITDPSVEEITLMKSARIGYTSMISAGIGYHIEHDPCSQLVVQPTVDDGKEFSKETIAPMLRDVPALAKIRVRDFEDKGARDASNTLTHKAFPGGILSIAGANSGTGLRRKTRRVVWFDEVDAYPASAGNEGDPIQLGKKRNETFWNRKTVAGSTPLIAGASRIEEMFESGDQRRYYVPCPHCGHMDFLTFREQTGEGARGHWMAFDSSSPEAAFATAHFVCRRCGCEIRHEHKRSMVERGEWRAAKPFRGHASFHIWSAYSYSPGASWGHIAKEFVEANKGGPEKLQTFVNTTLGETWVEKGEAPEWRHLYDRAESYERGTVPPGVVLLTAGIDVQADRLVYEVVGWGEDLQSWSIDAGVIPGDTSKPDTWDEADKLIARTFSGPGGTFAVRFVGVDSGFNTSHVYAWARRHPGRVIACKGVSGQRLMLGTPTSVDVKIDGKRIARGAKVWPVGVDMVKTELYGWLRLEAPTRESGKPYPGGYCHFPQHDEAYFKGITAEQLIKVRTKRGFVRLEWSVIGGRENHPLDCRVYARAVTALARLDQHAAAARARAAAAAPPPAEAQEPGDAPAPTEAAEPSPAPQQPAEAPRPRPAPPRGGFGGDRPRGGWSRRR
jgi:phage terminase large subunit GpA-like protein